MSIVYILEWIKAEFCSGLLVAMEGETERSHRIIRIVEIRENPLIDRDTEEDPKNEFILE